MNRETLFWTALKLSEPDRGRFVDEACASEGEREWVLGMIRAYHEEDKFLNSPVEAFASATTVVNAPAPPDRSPVPPPPPREYLADVQRGGLPAIPGCEIERVLGEGGMGIVFKGRQAGLERDAAVKLLKARQAVPGSELAERFRREAKAMAKLAHPGIVSIYDSGQTGEGFPYFVMEYVPGEDLLHRIRRGAMPEHEAVKTGVRVCEALVYAHGLGFVHRDIKPQNILLGIDGAVKVADFGLVKLMENPGLTREGAVMGTPLYWAPEQSEPALSSTVDHRVDIYALGGTLYHMLCGIAPDKRYISPSILCRCDKRLDMVVERCMAPDPGLRYQTAEELLADLVEIRDTRPLRSRVLANAGVVAAAGVLAVLIAHSSLGRRIDDLIQDAWFAARPPITISDDLVLVAVTHDCLRTDRLGSWPWNREVHASLVDALAKKGAAAIAFDMFFPEKGESAQSHEEDRVLAEAANRHGGVIFPDFLDSSPGNVEGYAGRDDVKIMVAGGVEWASEEIRNAGAIPAQCHAERDDDDGKLRRVPLFMLDPRDPLRPRPNLGLALALELLGSEFSWSANSVEIENRAGEVTRVPVDGLKRMLVNYPKALDSIPAISYSALLAGDVDIDLKGKGIVVGFAADGLTEVTADKHLTVIDPLTPGVLVNAAIANSILTGEFLREGSPWASAGAGFVLAAILGVILLRPRVLLGTLLAVVFAGALLGAGFGAMAGWGLVFPLLSGLLTIAISVLGLLVATRFGKRRPDTIGKEKPAR